MNDRIRKERFERQHGIGFLPTGELDVVSEEVQELARFVGRLDRPDGIETLEQEFDEKWFDYNPHHVQSGPEGGQFTSAGGGGSSGGESISMEKLDSFTPKWSNFKSKKESVKCQNAVFEWTSNYDAINQALRGGDKLDWAMSPEQTTIRSLNKVFEVAGHTLEEDVLVYRGIGGTRAGLDEAFKVGAEFEDRGFVATSNSEKWAKPFAGETGFMFHITIPKGERVFSPDTDVEEEGISAAAEPELLLRRGRKFKVTGREGRIVKVTVIS